MKDENIMEIGAACSMFAGLVAVHVMFCFPVGGVIYQPWSNNEAAVGIVAIMLFASTLSFVALLSLIRRMYKHKQAQSEELTEALVQHCINNRVICTCLLRQYRVVVSQQCHRIASFLRLVLTQNSGTYYFEINAMLY